MKFSTLPIAGLCLGFSAVALGALGSGVTSPPEPILVQPEFDWTEPDDDAPAPMLRRVDAPLQKHTFEWSTQSWVSSGELDETPSNQVVYDNTCQSIVFSPPVDPCNTYSMAGRIPSTGDPKAPVGATDDNLIVAFTFQYATTSTLPSIEIKFFDLLGPCVSPAGEVPVADYTFASLPGSATAGVISYHEMRVDISAAPFCLMSDGDGVWDNTANMDSFTWSFNSYTPNDTGPVLAGDSLTAPEGNCTYGNPCGPCGGTGLDSANNFWIEEDSPGCGGSATACYWYGGWPQANFSMQLESLGDCGTPNTYCTAGTSANSCQALLSATGTASASASSGFTVTASTVEGNKDGLFFIGTSGAQALPWGSGTSYRCIVPPTKRMGLMLGTGTSGLCDGSFNRDFNAVWCPSCPKPSKNPGVGVVTYAQLWYRDPMNTSNRTSSLSDGLQFVVGP